MPDLTTLAAVTAVIGSATGLIKAVTVLVRTVRRPPRPPRLRPPERRRLE